jgi:hypothetical protein
MRALILVAPLLAIAQVDHASTPATDTQPWP